MKLIMMKGTKTRGELGDVELKYVDTRMGEDADGDLLVILGKIVDCFEHDGLGIRLFGLDDDDIIREIGLSE